jgi:hypothetical protein
MEIHLKRLEDLREEFAKLDKDAFLQRYPGAFLLAMGFLAVEEIKAVRSGVEASDRSGDGFEPTAAFIIGPRPRHDAEQAHPLAGSTFFLRPTGAKPHVHVGRSDSNDITIPDSSVSEIHCRIEINQDGVYIVDLASTNGTSVNLERLEPDEPQLLADEDIVSVGRYSFQLLSSRAFHTELSLMQALDRRKREE